MFLTAILANIAESLVLETIDKIFDGSHHEIINHFQNALGHEIFDKDEFIKEVEEFRKMSKDEALRQIMDLK